MNKNDWLLSIVLLFLGIFFIVLFNILESNSSKKAIVYYEKKIVLEIDLSIKEKKEYEVKGYNGTIKIISENGKVKVIEEESPLHLCSKQGYISKSYESIICLPNKVVIEIVDNDSMDAVVR